MKKIGIVLLILISLTGTLLGCGKQDVNKDLNLQAGIFALFLLCLNKNAFCYKGYRYKGSYKGVIV